MKVIKRDGRVVEFNSEKIFIAVQKANKEVKKKEEATQKQIREIIKYIQELDKKRILVEDIQDIIEKKLMEMEKYELSKKYIVYRYTRALVRRQNTTDETILGLIRNQNNGIIGNNLSRNTMIASAQRNFIAGEVSKDLTNRMLLPKKIVNAHKEGVIYFHDAEYFIQPIINSCSINIEDMLYNGTAINNRIIDTPKTFRVACIVITQIINSISCNQYGEQFVNINCLGNFLRKSKEKYKDEFEKKYKGKISEEIINQLIDEQIKNELKSGIQTLIYQINTQTIINEKKANVTLIFDNENEKDNKYSEENKMIIEELKKQQKKGIKNTEGKYIPIKVPKLIFDGNKHKGKEGYFNQGVVSINLRQIAINTKGDEEKFWIELNDKLELCYEALMCRHYSLLGTLADVSPIHWMYGAIARLKSGEKIDSLLKSEKSSLSLGYIGINEAVQLITEKELETKEAEKLKKAIIDKLNENINQWKLETNMQFELKNI